MEKQTTKIMNPQSPTTFVQADTATFRDLVQKLTGSTGDSSTNKLPSRTPSDATAVRRSPFKLQDRRHTTRKLEIQLGRTSIRNNPSPIRSPVTPLRCESVFSARFGAESPSPSPAAVEEEKAIAEKRFYLHPSPLSTPRASEPPELLTLFPLTSPRK